MSQETLLRLAYKAKKSPDALQVLQDALAEKYPDLWNTYTETAEGRARSSNSKWYVLFSPRQVILSERLRAKKKIGASHQRWGVDRPLKLVDNNHLMIRLEFSSRTMDYTPREKIRQNPNKYFDTYFTSERGNIIVYMSRHGDYL